MKALGVAECTHYKNLLIGRAHRPMICHNADADRRAYPPKAHGMYKNRRSIKEVHVGKLKRFRTFAHPRGVSACWLTSLLVCEAGAALI